MTPRVLGREFEAARLRAVDEYRRDVTLAWNISRVFFRTKGKKQLIDLKQLVEEVKAAESDGRTSAGEMKQMLEMLAATYGMKLRVKKT